MKRIISLILACCMVVGMLPMTVSAEGGEPASVELTKIAKVEAKVAATAAPEVGEDLADASVVTEIGADYTLKSFTWEYFDKGALKAQNAGTPALPNKVYVATLTFAPKTGYEFVTSGMQSAIKVEGSASNAVFNTVDENGNAIFKITYGLTGKLDGAEVPDSYVNDVVEGLNNSTISANEKEENDYAVVDGKTFTIKDAEDEYEYYVAKVTTSSGKDTTAKPTDATKWNKEGIFTGLAAGTKYRLYIRCSETDTHNVSAYKYAEFTTQLAAQTVTWPESITLTYGKTLKIGTDVEFSGGKGTTSYTPVDTYKWAALGVIWDATKKEITTGSKTGSVELRVFDTGANTSSSKYAAKEHIFTINVTHRTTNTTAVKVTQADTTYGVALPDYVVAGASDFEFSSVQYRGLDNSFISYGDKDFAATKPTEAGEYEIEVRYVSANVEYIATDKFVISKKDISSAVIKLDNELLTYNGQNQTKKVESISLAGYDLTLSDCTIYGNTASEAGIYTMTITAKPESNYTGSFTAKYYIYQKYLSGVIYVNGVKSYSTPYTGKAIEPTIEFVDSDIHPRDNLQLDKDYTVVYKNNVNAGKASITVDMTPNCNYAFTQPVTVYFTIDKIDNDCADVVVSEVLANTAATKSVNLLNIAKELFGNGAKVSNVRLVSYLEAAFSAAPAYDSSTNTVTYSTNKDKTTTTGTIATYTFDVESTNYNTKTMTLEINVVEFLSEREVTASGKCGDNLTWTLYADGELVIDGTGAMWDWSYPDYAPWYSNRSKIKTLTIGDSVTSIGDYAFRDCSSLTSVEIPASVTSIGYSAFQYCSSLTSVEIPDSVTSIGNGAFSYCSSLTSVEIPASVTSIGNGAFSYCSSLTSVEIPASVTSIGDYAFGNCDSLTSITVDGNNTKYSNDEYGVLFNKDKTTLIQYPKGNERTTYTLPASVTSIGDSAFDNCDSLTSVEIPASVTSIGDYAFYSCDSLTKATIYSRDAKFGSSVFNDISATFEIHGYAGSTAESYATANGYTFVAIPEREVTASGTCGDDLTWVLYADGELVIYGTGGMWNYSSGSAPWCSNRSNIKKLTIGDSVTSVGDWAFAWCDSLTSVEIPASVTSIGDFAFYYCSSLTSVEIPDSVTSIGGYAFKDCRSLTSITVDGNNTKYSNDEYGVLFNKDKTTLIQYPIGNERTTYTIPDSVTSIGDRAFVLCDSLTSVEIPASVTSIGDWTFAYCRSLTKATIYSRDARFGSSVFNDISATFEIHGYAGSTAEVYATANGHTFVAIDAPIVPPSTGDGVIKRGTATVDGNLDPAYTGSLSIAYGPETNEWVYNNWDETASVTTYYMYDDTNLYLFADVIDDEVTSAGEEAATDPTGVKNETNDVFMWRLSMDGTTNVIKIGVDAYGYNLFGLPAHYDIIDYDEMTYAAVITEDGYHIEVSVPCSKGLTDIIAAGKLGIAMELCDLRRDGSFGNMCWATPGREYNAVVFYDLSDEAAIPYENNKCGNNLTWKIDDEGTLIISGTGDMWDWPNEARVPWYAYRPEIKAVVINEGVTSIGIAAFSDFLNMESIVISDSVTSIGDVAMRRCIGLTEIVIPEGVTTIGGYAFYGCRRLAEVTIPASVTNIGDGVFSECGKLTSITVDENNTAYSSDEYGVLFNKDKTVLVQYPAGSSNTEYVIPASVTVIGNNAFVNADSLTSVEIPDSVTTIEERAFYDCDGFTEITLGKNVTTIEGDAFRECDGLTSIEIPESVTSIGGYAFMNCDSLTKAVIRSRGVKFGLCVFDGTSADFELHGYEYSTTQAYANKRGYTFVIIPETIASGECGENLTWILYEDGELVIEGAGDMWRWRDSSLVPWCDYRGLIETVTVGDGVTSIGDRAFFYCTNLMNAEISSSVTAIGAYAFAGCRSLEKVVIYSVDVAFGASIFSGASSYFEIYGYKNSTARSYAAANGYTFVFLEAIAYGVCGDSLTWVLYDDGELEIDGTGAMWNWEDSSFLPWYNYRTRIQTVTIGDDVTSIGRKAFFGCNRIVDIVIPDGITVIGEEAFVYATRLKKATVYSRDAEFGEFVFDCVHANFELHGYRSSTAEVYANNNNHKFVALDAVETYVAAIGEDKYATLTAAIEAAAKGATIDLLADAEAVTVAKAITINKNGYAAAVTADGTTYNVVESDAAIVVYPMIGSTSGASLLLKDMIQINYKSLGTNFTNKGFTQEQVLANGKLLVWTSDDATYLMGTQSETIDLTYESGSKAYVGNTDGIPARLMGDIQKYRFCITDADGVVWYSNVKEYSPKTYAINMYGKDSTSANDKALIVAMMNYGAAAQINFEYDTENLMNSFLPEELQNVYAGYTATELKTDAAGKFQLPTTSEIVKNFGKSAVLKGAIEINIQLNMQTAHKNSELTLLYWTEETYNAATTLTEENATGAVAFDKSSSYPAALINGIPARLLGDTVFFCVKAVDADGNVFYSPLQTYSIHQYCVNTIAKDSSTEAVKNLAAAILVYSNAAETALNNDVN